MDKEYAIYKRDSYLFAGTVKELAERLKIKVETVSFYSRSSYLMRKENKTDGIIAVPLD